MNDGTLVITGLAETKRALRDYDKTLLNELNKKLREEGNQVRDLARLRIEDTPPAKGWRTTPAQAGRSRGSAGWPAWDSREIRRRITFVAGGKKKVRGSVISDAYSLKTDSAAGVIYELSGRKSRGRGTGRTLIWKLDQKGQASRGIWASLDLWGRERLGQALKNIIQEAEADLERRLAAANDREVIR